MQPSIVLNTNSVIYKVMGSNLTLDSSRRIHIKTFKPIIQQDQGSTPIIVVSIQYLIKRVYWNKCMSSKLKIIKTHHILQLVTKNM
jgi:hypothetical protein